MAGKGVRSHFTCSRSASTCWTAASTWCGSISATTAAATTSIPEIFHSCRIQEVVGAVRRIQELNPGLGLNLVGFSLGGNFFLRVAARARAAGLDLERVVAVCPVVDPEHTLKRLEGGWPVYRRYFVWKWHRSLRQKQSAWPALYDLADVQSLDNLTDMTDQLARRYGGYPSLEDYLRGYAVTGDALATICHPTRIITAADDPIIPGRATSIASRARRHSRSRARRSAVIAATTTRGAAAPGSSARSTRRCAGPDRPPAGGVSVGTFPERLASPERYRR